jgi:hypothetical protein
MYKATINFDQWSVHLNTASADFCQPFLAPHDNHTARQIDRLPRARHATFTGIPAVFTSAPGVTTLNALSVDRASVACSSLQPAQSDTKKKEDAQGILLF